MKIIESAKSFLLGPINGVKTLDASDGVALIELAEENRIAVGHHAAQIERSLEGITMRYFFKDHCDPTMVGNFRTFVIGSSWCMFTSKAQLVSLIIENTNFKDRKWRDSYTALLKKVIGFRNAFTHGRFVSNGHAVQLEWSTSKPEVATLTDDWISTVEDRLNEAYQKSMEILHFIDTRNTGGSTCQTETPQ